MIATGGSLALVDLFGELWSHLEQVAHHAVVDQLEDRRFGILVDGHDHLRGLHAGPVLNGAGDADRDVELWRDGLARLADLELVGVPPGVGRRPGRADGGAERVGQVLNDLEVLRTADAAATGDDDGGLGELGPVTLLLDDPFNDLGAPRGFRQRHRHLYLGRCRRCGLRGDGVRTYRDDRGAGRDLRVGDDGPTEDRVLGDEI